MMGSDKGAGDQKQGKYPKTHWSIVLAAGQSSSDARKKALAALCAIYWEPVYAFIRAKGRRAEEARDLTQEFFTTRLIEENDHAAADPTRGRFRNWLLKAVSSYLANEYQWRKRQKRDPGTELVSIDTSAVEGECPVQVGHHTTPERMYELRWAMVLLRRALQKLEESYQKRGEGLLFEKIKPLLVEVPAASNTILAAELGMREGTFKVAVSRCRSRFQERIRAEIAETVTNEDEIENELRYLCACIQPRQTKEPAGVPVLPT